MLTRISRPIAGGSLIPKAADYLARLGSLVLIERRKNEKSSKSSCNVVLTQTLKMNEIILPSMLGRPIQESGYHTWSTARTERR